MKRRIPTIDESMSSANTIRYDGWITVADTIKRNRNNITLDAVDIPDSELRDIILLLANQLGRLYKGSPFAFETDDKTYLIVKPKDPDKFTKFLDKLEIQFERMVDRFKIWAVASNIEVARGLIKENNNMKQRIPTLDDFINESKTEAIDVAPGVVLKKTKVGGKITWTLKMDEQAYKKIAKLFDEKGNPKDRKKMTYTGPDNTGWIINSISATYSDGKKSYAIYGVSGDYTFGQSPTYYQSKLRGNIKAAKMVYDQFIKDHIK